MEKVVGKQRTNIAGPSEDELLGLARERVTLPDVDMNLDYQDDVDTLIIRFKEPITEEVLESLDEDSGVMPIYDPALTHLIGIEILDICGQLQYADPT